MRRISLYHCVCPLNHRFFDPTPFQRLQPLLLSNLATMAQEDSWGSLATVEWSVQAINNGKMRGFTNLSIDPSIQSIDVSVYLFMHPSRRSNSLPRSSCKHKPYIYTHIDMGTCQLSIRPNPYGSSPRYKMICSFELFPISYFE